MQTARHRIFLTPVFTLAIFGLFALNGTAAYSDDLYIEGSVQEEIFDGDAVLEDIQPQKRANPVVVFKNQLKGITSAVNTAARDIAAGGINTENNFAFVLAGLFFLMLMVRFRKRSKRHKF